MDLKKEFEQADMLISQSKRVNMQIKIAKKYAEYTQSLQLLQPDVSTSVCVCKVCDKLFGDTLSLWEHFYHNHIKETN